MLWWIAPSERSWNDEKDIGHQKARFAEYAVYPAGAVCYQFWRGMANGTRGGCFRKVSFADCGSAWGAAKFLAKPASIGLVGRAVLWRQSEAGGDILKSKNAKKYRHGLEYGSARWGTREDIAPYVDPVFQNNVILTKTESLTMNSRPKDPKTARNKNVLVIGGSGSGKTRFWLKPNLMQMHSSYVVTDPKGSIVIECGNALLKHGYTIKIFNTINFQKSMHYNPFAYIHSEKDILKLVTTLIANTKGDGKAGDEFWTSATRSQAVKSLRTGNGFPLFGDW